MENDDKLGRPVTWEDGQTDPDTGMTVAESLEAIGAKPKRPARPARSRKKAPAEKAPREKAKKRTAPLNAAEQMGRIADQLRLMNKLHLMRMAFEIDEAGDLFGASIEEGMSDDEFSAELDRILETLLKEN